jgi:hypothetical protein
VHLSARKKKKRKRETVYTMSDIEVWDLDDAVIIGV